MYTFMNCGVQNKQGFFSFKGEEAPLVLGGHVVFVLVQVQADAEDGQGSRSRAANREHARLRGRGRARALGRSRPRRNHQSLGFLWRGQIAGSTRSFPHQQVKS